MSYDWTIYINRLLYETQQRVYYAIRIQHFKRVITRPNAVIVNAVAHCHPQRRRDIALRWVREASLTLWS
ncbi:hypothetical protein J6590_073218 [Homalodisca vitripennis]|nr:hypothetical protein J6590_073218 [Homalodisca vitripennis]